jgi:hypothetical protein
VISQERWITLTTIGDQNARTAELLYLKITLRNAYNVINVGNHFVRPVRKNRGRNKERNDFFGVLFLRILFFCYADWGNGRKIKHE